MSATPPADHAIRPARQQDLPAIAELWGDFMAHHARIDPRYEAAADGAAVFQRHLKQTVLGAQDALLLVAEAPAGALNGYVLARQSLLPPVFARRRYGVITDLMVAAGARGRGLGRALAQRALSWLAERGESQVEVRMLGLNRDAVGFWARLGFNPHLTISSLELGADAAGGGEPAGGPGPSA